MALIAQLSDLHLLSGEAEQAEILAALVDAMRRELAEKARSLDLLAITGDVFDSASRTPAPSVNAFLRLHAELRVALGRDVPTVIVISSRSALAISVGNRCCTPQRTSCGVLSTLTTPTSVSGVGMR